MKKLLTPMLIAVLCTASSLFAQTTPAASPPGTAPPVQAHSPLREDDELYSFDLDFPGGTPVELVKAIQMRQGRHRDGEAIPNIPLNVIIPSDCKSVALPAIRVERVTVADLFAALGKTAGKESAALYQFTCEGAPRNNSVWTFWSPLVDSSLTQRQPNECRFYELAPYLETYKVEDITTVLQTAWQMLGEPSIPHMEFHKETKLLIVVGHPNQLQVINDALRQLGGGGISGGGGTLPRPGTMSPAMMKRYNLGPEVWSKPPTDANDATPKSDEQRLFERYHIARPLKRAAQTNDTTDPNEVPVKKPQP